MRPRSALCTRNTTHTLVLYCGYTHAHAGWCGVQGNVQRERLACGSAQALQQQEAGEPSPTHSPSRQSSQANATGRFRVTNTVHGHELLPVARKNKNRWLTKNQTKTLTAFDHRSSSLRCCPGALSRRAPFAVCSPRPRRASSAPPIALLPRWERRLKPQAARRRARHRPLVYPRSARVLMQTS